MSKARVINNISFKERVKRFLAPKHPFMKLFGATDAFLDYSQGFNDVSFSAIEIGLGPASFVPLPTQLPLGDSLPEADHVYKTSETILLPEKADISEPKIGQIEHNADIKQAEDLEGLLSILDSSGLKVSDVETLPSRVTRITLDDLFDISKSREPEYVKVRV